MTHPAPPSREAVRQEAQDKLRHYAAIYGEWIYRLTVQSARCLAQARRRIAKSEGADVKGIKAWIEAIHFHAIAEALAVFND